MNREQERPRSKNDVAYDILQVAPQVEPLIEEWFAIDTQVRSRTWDDALARLGRIRAAAESDADLALLPALRDFLLRETEPAALPGTGIRTTE